METDVDELIDFDPAGFEGTLEGCLLGYKAFDKVVTRLRNRLEHVSDEFPLTKYRKGGSEAWYSLNVLVNQGISAFAEFLEDQLQKRDPVKYKKFCGMQQKTEVEEANRVLIGITTPGSSMKDLAERRFKTGVWEALGRRDSEITIDVQVESAYEEYARLDGRQPLQSVPEVAEPGPDQTRLSSVRSAVIPNTPLAERMPGRTGVSPGQAGIVSSVARAADGGAKENQLDQATIDLCKRLNEETSALLERDFWFVGLVSRLLLAIQESVENRRTGETVASEPILNELAVMLDEMAPFLESNQKCRQALAEALEVAQTILDRPAGVRRRGV